MSYTKGDRKKIVKVLSNLVLEEGISKMILDYSEDLKNEELFKYEYKGDYKKIMNDYINDKIKLDVKYFSQLKKKYSFEYEYLKFNLEDYLNNNKVYKRLNKILKMDNKYYCSKGNINMLIYERIIETNYKVITDLYFLFHHVYDDEDMILEDEEKIKGIINIINKFYLRRNIYNDNVFLFRDNLRTKKNLNETLYKYLNFLVLNIDKDRLIKYGLDKDITENTFLMKEF